MLDCVPSQLTAVYDLHDTISTAQVWTYQEILGTGSWVVHIPSPPLGRTRTSS